MKNYVILNFFVPLLIGAKDNANLTSFNKERRNITGNFILSKRELRLNNINYQKNYSTEIKQACILNAYLAGLFEGDGHIVLNRVKDSVGKTENNKELFDESRTITDKNIIKSVVIAITFNIKDLPLCEHLKKIIGGGWIRIKRKENACVLIFQTDKGVIKFVELINGYLRSPKLCKFNIVIDYLNKKYLLDIGKYEVDTTNINSNSWFAGFADADAGLQITIYKSGGYRCELRIEQRMIDPFSGLSYKPLFSKIAEFLGGKLYISIHNKTKEYFLVRCGSNKNLPLILNYFSLYSMYSSKRLDYNNWKEAVLLKLSGKNRLSENKKIVYNLKHSMNNKRTVFDWSHLIYLK